MENDRYIEHATGMKKEFSEMIEGSTNSLQTTSVSRRSVLEQVTVSLGLLGISIGGSHVLSEQFLSEKELSELRGSNGSSLSFLSERVLSADKLKQHTIKGKLFHLYEGQSIGLGWNIQRITYVYFEETSDMLNLSLSDIFPIKGHLIVDLVQNNIIGKQEAQVHVCSHRGHPKGLAHTQHLDFFLMNSSGRTDEYLGRVLLSFAHKISLMERDDRSNTNGFLSILDYLQTYEERLASLNHMVAPTTSKI